MPPLLAAANRKHCHDLPRLMENILLPMSAPAPQWVALRYVLETIPLTEADHHRAVALLNHARAGQEGHRAEEVWGELQALRHVVVVCWEANFSRNDLRSLADNSLILTRPTPDLWPD